MHPIILNNLERLKALCKLHKVEQMHLFGSLATNTANDKSDIDFLVKFSPSVELLEYANNYFGLQEKLELLFNKKIDLVSEKSLKNPVLIQEINNTKVALL